MYTYVYIYIYHRLVVQLGTLRTPLSHVSMKPLMFTNFVKEDSGTDRNRTSHDKIRQAIRFQNPTFNGKVMNQSMTINDNQLHLMCQCHSISPHLCSFLIFSRHLFLSLAILHQVFLLTAVKLRVRMRIPNHSHKNGIYNVENRSRWWFQRIWIILVKLDHFPR